MVLISKRTSVARIIAVTGLPCTGKSTLADQLQQYLAWPLLAKDTIKESLFDSLGWNDRAWSRRLSDASYELMFAWLTQVIRSGGDVIVEANFRFPQHAQRFAALRDLGAVRLFQIVCVTEGELLKARYLERACSGNRHPGHLDFDTYTELAPQLAIGRTAATRLPTAEWTMEWDTTYPDAAVEPLLNRLHAALQASDGISD